MENPDSVLWLTYDEAASRMGIKADSVRRRASLRKWPRKIGNDGLARIGVPASAIPDRAPDIPPALPPDSSELSALRAELSSAREEAMELRKQLADAREHGARLEGEASASAARLADAHAERDRLSGLLEQALQPRPTWWDRLLRR